MPKTLPSYPTRAQRTLSKSDFKFELRCLIVQARQSVSDDIIRATIQEVIDLHPSLKPRAQLTVVRPTDTN